MRQEDTLIGVGDRRILRKQVRDPRTGAKPEHCTVRHTPMDRDDMDRWIDVEPADFPGVIEPVEMAAGGQQSLGQCLRHRIEQIGCTQKMDEPMLGDEVNNTICEIADRLGAAREKAQCDDIEPWFGRSRRIEIEHWD